MTTHYDVAVVGAGIIGLAHAYHLARAGRRVVVFERHPKSQGASIRNFGMLWPIGQPSGPLATMAMRSLQIWHDVLESADLWHNRCGSLHLAYHDDEAVVLRQFAEQACDDKRPCELLSPRQVTDRYPHIVPDRLRAGLFSSSETNVDPRQVIDQLPAWLNERWGVDFHFGTTVLGHNLPHIATSTGIFTAERLLICTGIDFRELAPTAFADTGIINCKLQMMRSQAFGNSFSIGPMLAAGLTLGHYKAFATCPGLVTLRRRFDAEMPEYGKFGIHVMVSQNQSGELIIGDSHEYGDAIEPFDNPLIDDMVLRYLKTFLRPPELRIAARWHGIYAKHPTEPFVATEVAPNVVALAGVGGAGMTLSFGLAEYVLRKHWGDAS